MWEVILIIQSSIKIKEKVSLCQGRSHYPLNKQQISKCSFQLHAIKQKLCSQGTLKNVQSNKTDVIVTAASLTMSAEIGRTSCPVTIGLGD